MHVHVYVYICIFWSFLPTPTRVIFSLILKSQILTPPPPSDSPLPPPPRHAAHAHRDTDILCYRNLGTDQI